ncbi:hypothetical protein EVAR_13486_1 [Eumeta japonica]|uniref:Uncharacterized protein n=1 Tax=Eumeta variegata TaxID=151549 RepID=A0A4C1UZB8_EUMVA|nr:hypothetical protein EVAR_13486_1 [Eumeta japonica]
MNQLEKALLALDEAVTGPGVGPHRELNDDRKHPPLFARARMTPAVSVFNPPEARVARVFNFPPDLQRKKKSRYDLLYTLTISDQR